MQRIILAALLLVACGDKTPAAPDPKQFAALGEEAKCEATLPRARKCIDELMAQQIEGLMQPTTAADKEATQQLAKEVRAEKSFSDEAEKLHQLNCAGSNSYADAVVTCWDKPDCKTFATCVLAHDTGMHGAKPTSPSPRSPSPSGTAP